MPRLLAIVRTVLACTGRYDRRSTATPDQIFWTPGLAAQMTPTLRADGGAAPSGRGLDGFAGASAAESQHHALSSLLGTLQAATQKGSNRSLRNLCLLWIASFKRTILTSTLQIWPFKATMRWMKAPQDVCWYPWLSSLSCGWQAGMSLTFTLNMYDS